MLRKKTYRLLNNIHQPSCIILGGATITALSLIWDLGKKGIPVICVDGSRFVPGGFSRYCSSMEDHGTEADLMSKLEEIGRISRQKNIIFCESDKYLLFLEKSKEVLKGHFHFSYPLKMGLGELMNKRVQLRLAQEAGLSIPRTFFSDEGARDRILDKMRYPAFIKPLYSQTQYRKKGEVVRHRNEAEAAMDQRRFVDGYMIQEVIEGSEENLWMCLGCCDTKGDPLALFTLYKKRQLPKDFGVGTVAVSQENKTVIDLTKSFLARTGYCGCFGLEFKKCRDTDEYKFIEFNTRVTMPNELVRFCGIDLPYISYCDFLGLPIRDNPRQRNGVLWQSISDDFITIAKYYSKESPMFFLEWVKTIFKAGVYGDLSLFDMGPFLCKILRHLFKRAKRS